MRLVQSHKLQPTNIWLGRLNGDDTILSEVLSNLSSSGSFCNEFMLCKPGSVATQPLAVLSNNSFRWCILPPLNIQRSITVLLAQNGIFRVHLKLFRKPAQYCEQKIKQDVFSAARNTLNQVCFADFNTIIL